MELLSVSEGSLRRAAEVLRGGGLVAFPTETVYGLGADAFNPTALAKIFEAKGRPRFDPLIVHIAAIKTLEKITDLSWLNPNAGRKLRLLAENLWPGPLSLVLPKSALIPDIATAGLPTVAVRFPDHPVAREIISLSTGAIAAPSANPFGYLSPTRAEHVREMLGDKTDIILDGGPARIGVESTVLNLCSEDIQILRYGGTPKEKIEELIGPTMGISCEMDESAGLVSPGRLKSHYAPRKALLVFSREAIISQSVKADCAFLFFDGPSRDAWLAAQVGAGVPEKTVVRVLSEYGDILEAAARLFEILHELDRYPAVPDNGFSRILAQLAPEKGLGAAINDRLRRAGGV